MLAARLILLWSAMKEIMKVRIASQRSRSFLPTVTIMLPMEDQTPRQFSYTHLCESSEKRYDKRENVADLLGHLKGILFLQYYQHLILTQRCCFQSCSIRNT